MRRSTPRSGGTASTKEASAAVSSAAVSSRAPIRGSWPGSRLGLGVTSHPQDRLNCVETRSASGSRAPRTGVVAGQRARYQWPGAAGARVALRGSRGAPSGAAVRARDVPGAGRARWVWAGKHRGAFGGRVGQQDLPGGAGAGGQLPVQLGTGECPAAQRHDAPVALRNVAEIEWLAEAGLQAVDLAEARIRKLIGHGWFLFDGSLVAAA